MDRQFKHVFLLSSMLACALVIGCGQGKVVDSPVVTQPPAATPTPSPVQSQAVAESSDVADVPPSEAIAEQPSPQSATPGVPVKSSVTVDQSPREPATVDEVVALLDLRSLPVYAGAELSDERVQIGELRYEVKADVQTTFDFHRRQLVDRGWQELSEGRQDGEYPSVFLTQRGFVLHLSAMKSFEPDKSDHCNLSLYNCGNVPLSKLPVPTSVEPHYSTPREASYVTKDDAEATREWCRSALLDLGWRPYGSAGDMLYFKRNAVKLSAWVQTHENQPGKTFIRYSTELMSADIPMPEGVEHSQYIDSMKRLTFVCSNTRFPELTTFYTDSLAKQGWKPTSEPVTGDRTTSVVYRNVRGDIMTLDMENYSEASRVAVVHRTAAQVATLAQKMRDEATKRAVDLASADPTTTTDTPALPTMKLPTAPSNSAKRSIEDLAKSGDIAGLENAVNDLVGGLLGGLGESATGKLPLGELPMKDEPADAPVASERTALRVSEVIAGKGEGHVKLNDQSFAMHHAIAYQEQESDETVTVVFVSEKPFRTRSLTGKTADDISVFDARATDDPPTMELRIRGDYVSLSCFISGASINFGSPKIKTEAKVAEGKLQGKVFLAEPEEFFDDLFQFNVTLDVPLMKFAEQAASARELVDAGTYTYPLPEGCSETSQEKTPYRSVVRGTLKVDLAQVVDFYRVVLTEGEWKEDIQAAKIEKLSAQMSFHQDDIVLSLQLRQVGDQTQIALAGRDEQLATKDGIAPKAGQTRIMLGNASDSEIVISIDGKDHKLAAGVGGENPAEAVKVDIAPGQHTITVKASGQPPETETAELTADTTWGVIGFPGGGYFFQRMY